MILDPTQGHHASHVPAEQRLIISVINRAVLDLFTKVVMATSQNEKKIVKADALQFLTASDGPWAKRRDELCVIIDRCPDKLRVSVIDILEGRAHSTCDDRHSLNDIEHARSLWRDSQKTRLQAQEDRKARAMRIKGRRLQRRVSKEPISSDGPHCIPKEKGVAA